MNELFGFQLEKVVATQTSVALLKLADTLEGTFLKILTNVLSSDDSCVYTSRIDEFSTWLRELSEDVLEKNNLSENEVANIFIKLHQAGLA